MKLLITLSFLGFFFIASSQDFHHWSEHFGARASLLGGAATSGLGDNATVYYNPAAMSFVKDPSLSISVNAYRIRHLKMDNALGDGLDLKGTQLATAPNLIAGIVEIGKKKKLRLGYGVISRRNFTAKYDYLHTGNYEISSATAGDETFIGSYGLFHSLSEYWGGFGVSYKLTKGLSIGFAHYGIYRDVKYSNSYEMSVLPSDGSTGTVSSVASNVSFNYWNVKGIFKPSIALSVENFKFGLAVTTPSFNILGKSNVYRDYSIRGLNQIIGTDITFIDRAEKQKVTHKESGALAVGCSWRLGKNSWLHFTHETFFRKKYYLMWDPDQVPNAYPQAIEDSTIYGFFGDQNFLAFGEQDTSVTNFGLGFETKLTPRWDLYLGMRTDFLYNNSPYFLFDRIAIDASKWSLYHASAGVVYETKKAKRYTVGVEFGFSGRREYYHIADFTSPRINNGLIGDGGLGAYGSQYSFKLLLEIEIGQPNEADIEETLED